jgi:hypothetical protein
MTSPQDKSFEYWVNVYENHVDMGGSTRGEADANAEFMANEFRRIDCRLLRYTPGKGLRDVTPKRKYVRNVSEEQRAESRERINRLWAEGKMGRKKSTEAGREHNRLNDLPTSE